MIKEGNNKDYKMFDTGNITNLGELADENFIKYVPLPVQDKDLL